MLSFRIVVVLAALSAVACGAAPEPEPSSPNEVVVEPAREVSTASANTPPPPRTEKRSVVGRLTCTPGADEARLSESRDLFKSGIKSIQDGDFARAVEAFRESYERSCKPAILYNLAVSYEKMGEPSVAADLYEQFAEESPGSPQLDYVREKIRSLRKQGQ
jgi:hypothetical protein